MMNKQVKATLLLLASVLCVSTAQAQETQEKRYISPPEYPENVYFGDPHIHTSVSADAALWGCTLGPEDTYT